mmetsp:Transcript_58247/g.162400  ORF Transcript_58247/g.162400 Transcript_58247/m.162400 type:complete len:300 (+) Transcript_58247:118-1017(+)
MDGKALPRSSVKAYAAAALDRAEAAARRADEATRRGADGRALQAGGSAPSTRSSLPALGQAWHPGASTRVAEYLRRSHELHSVSGCLRERQCRSSMETLACMDRQIAAVEHTRALIAAVRERHAPAAFVEREGTGSSESSRARCTRATPSGGGDCLIASPADDRLIAQTTAEEPIVPASAPEESPAPRPRPAPRVLELRPKACTAEDAGKDCACCLATMLPGDALMSFPCPAQHRFHAGCLTQWLRLSNAGSAPLVRAPRARCAARGRALGATAGIQPLCRRVLARRDAVRRRGSRGNA